MAIRKAVTNIDRILTGVAVKNRGTSLTLTYSLIGATQYIG